MGELRLENSNYVVYVLQRENLETLVMNKAPDGWETDELGIVRNKKYHGILTEFTGALKFRGAEKDFINFAYSINGLNTNLYLIRYQLKAGESYIIGDDIDTVKFRIQYKGIADFETKKEAKGHLEINFNSQELDKLIESYQSDDLSIDRQTDLENNPIVPMIYNRAEIKGRDLQGIGWQENTMPVETGEQFFHPTEDFDGFSIPSSFGIKGFGRHIEVNDLFYKIGSSLSHQSKFFYNDLDRTDNVDTETTLEVRLKFRIKTDIYFAGEGLRIQPMIRKYNFNEDTSEYDFVGKELIPISAPNHDWLEFDGLVRIYEYGELTNTNALSIAFGFNTSVSNGFWRMRCEIEHYKIEVKETSRYVSDSPTYSFSFVNDVASRLMEIITGKKNKFYSKVFGRAELTNGANYQDYTYAKDGEWGNIGLIHGFDIRQFDKSNQLYKGMELSLKTLMDSLDSVFSIGVGIEESHFGSRLRIERKQHFYQPSVVIRLPHQVTELTRAVDGKMFNSSCSFGGKKGGDYEHGLGLDEPNVKTDYILPIRKTKNKYTQNSDLRSDDTGLELTRRQPAYLDDTKDTSQDSHIWLLDLKKAENDKIYEQLHWSDALASAPTGIVDPDSYRSWRFTPKRSMFRHGEVLRAGMEQSATLDKYITLGSSNANINLETEYLPNVAPSEKLGPVREGGFEKAIRFDSALMLPEIISFRHPVDEELMELLLGTTQVLIGGEIEHVPNWYFKIPFINEEEEIESGYLISLKPKKGYFEFYKANESFNGVVDVIVEEPIFSPKAAWNGHASFKVSGTGFIRWNDGTPDTYYNGSMVVIEHFGEAFNQEINFYGTLTLLHIDNESYNFTHTISDLPEEMRDYMNYSTNLCTGNIVELPRNIARFEIDGWNSIEGDVRDFPTGLAVVTVGGYNTLTGNISEAPFLRNCGVWVMTGKNKISDYTPGTIFYNDMFHFRHLPSSGFGLSSSKVDSLLIDINNSGMNRGLIRLGGNNAPRTSASDFAVTQLQSRGVDVSTN